MIRPATVADTDALMTIAEASELFQPDELDEVRGMLGAHFAGELGPDHQRPLITA